MEGIYCFCKDCEDRWVKIIDGKLTRCHGTCEKYAQFRSELSKANEAKKKETEATGYIVESIKDMKKSRKRW